MSEIKEGNLAEIKDLSVSFMTDAGSIKAIDKISFEIPRKKVIGVVGESGSGKSVTARSLIKLLPETATTSGAVYLSNRAGTEELEVLSLSGEQLREMRGAEAAMVFQEPNSVLNPVYMCWRSCTETRRPAATNCVSSYSARSAIPSTSRIRRRTPSRRRSDASSGRTQSQERTQKEAI